MESFHVYNCVFLHMHVYAFIFQCCMFLCFCRKDKVRHMVILIVYIGIWAMFSRVQKTSGPLLNLNLTFCLVFYLYECFRYKTCFRLKRLVIISFYKCQYICNNGAFSMIALVFLLIFQNIPE